MYHIQATPKITTNGKLKETNSLYAVTVVEANTLVENVLALKRKGNIVECVTLIHIGSLIAKSIAGVFNWWS